MGTEARWSPDRPVQRQGNAVGRAPGQRQPLLQGWFDALQQHRGVVEFPERRRSPLGDEG